MSPAHKRRLILNNTGSPLHSSEDRFSSSGKHKKIEKGVMSHFRKRGSIKTDTAKVETSNPSTPTRFGNKMPVLSKSSSSYFPNPVEGGTKSQKSKSGAGGGLRGIWKRNSRKKTALKTDGEEWVDGTGSVEQSPAHELSRRLSLKRKNSIVSDKVILDSVCSTIQ